MINENMMMLQIDEIQWVPDDDIHTSLDYDIYTWQYTSPALTLIIKIDQNLEDDIFKFYRHKHQKDIPDTFVDEYTQYLVDYYDTDVDSSIVKKVIYLIMICG